MKFNTVTRWSKPQNTRSSLFQSTFNSFLQAQYDKRVEDDTKVLNSILSQDKTEISKSELLNVLLDCVETVAVNDSQIYIKLKKDLIIHGQNTAVISDGLNIQLAKLIHLNPDVSKVKSQINTLKKLEQH